MSFSANNLMFFRAQYNNIYHLLRNRDRNSNKFLLTNSKTGDPNLSVRIDHKETAISLHSNYNPFREADKWLEQYEEELTKGKHVLLYGFAMGYYLEKLINKYPEHKIYLFEPDIEIILACIEERDVKKILSHPNIVTFGVGDDSYTQDQFIHYFLNQIYDNFAFLIAPSYKKIYKNHLQQFSEALKQQTLLFRGNMHTNYRFREEWTKNTLLNLPKMVKSSSIYSLKDKFNDIPAIIVGSGPSLEQSIEYLKELKQRCLIIAAGSSVQALLKNNVVPHIVVSIDGGEANHKVFKNLDLTQTILAAGSYIYKEIINEYEGNLYHIPIENDTITTYLLNCHDVTPKIYSTSSVTGTAIQLALLFGCKSVIFVGQDLSFPNNQYYSGGVDHIDKEQITSLVNNADYTIENNNDGKNRTSKSMLITIRDIENLINYLEGKSKTQFINTSKIGAKIKGTEWQSLEDIHQQLKDSPVHNTDFQKILINQLKPYPDDFVKELVSKIEFSCIQIQKIKKGLLEIDEDLQQLQSIIKLDYTKTNKLLVDIEKKWKVVTKSKVFEYMYQFTMELQFSIYRRNLPIIANEKDISKKADLVYNHLGGLVNEMKRVSDLLLMYLNFAFDQIEAK